jgi:hypothetical protein
MSDSEIISNNSIDKVIKDYIKEAVIQMIKNLDLEKKLRKEVANTCGIYFSEMYSDPYNYQPSCKYNEESRIIFRLPSSSYNIIEYLDSQNVINGVIVMEETTDEYIFKFAKVVFSKMMFGEKFDIGYYSSRPDDIQILDNKGNLTGDNSIIVPYDEINRKYLLDKVKNDVKKSEMVKSFDEKIKNRDNVIILNLYRDIENIILAEFKNSKQKEILRAFLEKLTIVVKENLIVKKE